MFQGKMRGFVYFLAIAAFVMVVASEETDQKRDLRVQGGVKFRIKREAEAAEPIKDFYPQPHIKREAAAEAKEFKGKVIKILGA